MRQILKVCAAMAGLWSGVAIAADEGFTGRLAEADYKAAGLDKLTDAERARLDELVSEERVRGAAAEGDRPRAASKKPAPPPITRGRIAGTLTGWTEGTVLTFEDGSRWEIVSKGSYRAAPVRKGPKVELAPLVGGTFIMTVDTVPRRAEVRRVAE